MPDGNTINYPRPNYSQTAQYVKYTDVVSKDVKFENETLVINKHPVCAFEIDIEDEQDIGYDMIEGQITRNAFVLREEIDGDFFSEYINAENKNDTAIALISGASQNVTPTYGNVFATLSNNGVDTGRIGVVVDPFQLNMMGQAALGNTFNVADATYKNGYTGGTIQGMRVFISNNLTCIGTLALATQPTAWDTVTYNGVKFKFVAALADAGDVLRGADAAASRANLIAAINGAAWEGTTYKDVDTATSNVRANKLRGLTAEVVDTNVVLTSRRGFKPVSQTLAAAGNKFGQFVIYNIAMEQGAIHLVLRNNVMLKEESIQKQLGRRFITHTRYGIKTFTEGAERMYALAIEARPAE
jgi:hypothetical protein